MTRSKIINMETVIIILAILAGVIGIAGSILPGLPGTPFSWIGLLLLYIWGPEEMQFKTLIIWGVVVLIQLKGVPGSPGRILPAIPMTPANIAKIIITVSIYYNL